MLDRPAFPPHVRVAVVEDDGAALLLGTERGTTAIHGPLYARLGALIDGRRTADAIAGRLAGAFDPTHVYHALLLLERDGHLVPAGAPDEGPDPAPPPVPRPLLAGRRVTVHVLGSVPRGPVEARLAAHGATVTGRGDVVLAAVDDYLDPALAAVREAARDRGVPWLLLRPVGELTWIGPLFAPGRPGCWHCLAHRLRRHAPSDTGTLVRAATPPRRAAALAAAVDRAAAALAAWRPDGDHALARAVVTRDRAGGAERRHALTPRPQCPGCGDPARYARRVTDAALARALLRGAAEAPAVLDPDALVSPVTGLVDRIETLAGAAGGPVHVRVAGAGTRPGSGGSWRRRLHVCGAGLTGDAATRAVLAEAVERMSGTYAGDEPRVTARLAELDGRALHPNACLLVSDAQYRTREEWNRHVSAASRVPEPFDPGVAVAWTPVWSLTRNEPCHLPTALLYHGYPGDPDRACCPADSNGCAAGATPAEAVLHGLLELVERDSVALWWHHRVPRPAVDLDVLGEPAYHALGAHYRTLDRVFWVLDLTTDLGIPAYVAVTRRLTGPADQVLLGSAAAPDARTAVARAVSEMHALVATLATVPDEALLAPELRRWLGAARVAGEPHLAPAGMRAPPPPPPLPDPAARLAWCRDALERRGLEVLVLDQTRPDTGVPVVKVIVPGLRHLRPRYAPGRLYEAPVAAGWLPAPPREDALHRQPYPF